MRILVRDVDADKAPAAGEPTEEELLWLWHRLPLAERELLLATARREVQRREEAVRP